MKTSSYTRKFSTAGRLILLTCLFIAGTASGGLRDIIPRPQQMGSISNYPLIITGSFYLVTPDDPTAEELVVKEEVIRLFQEHNLRTPIAVEYSQFSGSTPALMLGTAERFPELAAILDSTGLAGLGTVQHGEEYQIYVDEFRILILGEDLRALRWGALTLMYLIGEINGTMFIDRVYIRDWPDFPKRIATANSQMRNADQEAFALCVADSAYEYKMNEIEWNPTELGDAPEEFQPWAAAFFFPHATAYKRLIRDRGQKLSVSVESTRGTCWKDGWQEAIPITGTPMRVGSSSFALVPTGYNLQVPNGTFESWSGSIPTGWRAYRDSLWSHFSRDTSIRHSGGSSLKVRNPGYDLALRQDVPVQPYGYYNLRIWCKTSGFQGAFTFGAQGTQEPRNGVIMLDATMFGMASTQDWTEIVIPFSSFHLDSIYLMIGPHSISSGTVWFDDIRIEAANLERLVRRADTPMRVYEEPGHLLRTEGVDYRVVETHTTSYEDYIHAPRLERIAGGALALNDLVSVDWGCGIKFQGTHTTVCFSLLEPLQRYQDHVRVADSLISPDGYKIHINETPYAGHDQRCQATGLTPAQLVGRYCNQMYEIIQAQRPGVPVRIYGDAFDYHNYDNRAMPTMANPWTRGDNGIGTLHELSTDVEIMAMTHYTSDLDSTFITYEQMGFSSVVSLMGDIDYDRKYLGAVITAHKYPDCKGLNAYGWYLTWPAKIRTFASLAWNIGPYILHSPAQPVTASDSVRIRAEVWTDRLGQSQSAQINSCIVRYRWLPSGSWVELNMGIASTDLFSVMIPPGGPAARELEYSIIATDSRNQTRRAPAGDAGQAFRVQFSSSTPNEADESFYEVQYTVTSISDYVVFEWEPISTAEYYEVHIGPNSDRHSSSRTLLMRLDAATPRYIASRSSIGDLDQVVVYAKEIQPVESAKSPPDVKRQ